MEEALVSEAGAAGTSFRPGVFEIGADGRGSLAGTRCPTCGAHFFPGRQVCARCLTEDLEPIAFSTTGTVYTYTVIHQAAPGFEVPLVLGYVDLPEGVRVLGQLVGVAPEEVRMGMEVTLVVQPFGKDEEGRTLLGYAFRPSVLRAEHQGGSRRD